MKYAIVIYENEAAFAERTDPVKAPAYWGAWSAYSEALSKAGVMTGGAGLEHPSTATLVKHKDGKRQVQDGPFATSKEMLGGFFLIDVPDLDTALDWASRAPSAAQTQVEVRPLLSVPG